MKTLLQLIYPEDLSGLFVNEQTIYGEKTMQYHQESIIMQLGIYDHNEK